MNVEPHIQQLDAILDHYQEMIGDDFLGYRNHVYRMVHFCLALQTLSEEEKREIYIAAAFHDIGIWVEDTVDYIPPSIQPAMDYLEENDLQDWQDEIGLMISEHHKIREYTDKSLPLVEIFRRGDLVDFSFGLFRFGIDKSYIETVRTAFPNADFHKGLAKRAGKWFLKHPLNPAPMMKW
ncbi:hypothetical protein [Thalassotalea litorea]|uniref:hypothetical protein n=1 Tax=Thalassotalea litorea TaxID=2020715 RepID=UPI003736AB33